MDDASVDAQAMKPIVEAFPQAKICRRVFDRRQLLAIDGSGVDGVIREVFESSIAMGLTALRHLDVDPSEMDDVEATLRLHDETRLQVQLDEGDLSAACTIASSPAADARPIAYSKNC